MTRFSNSRVNAKGREVFSKTCPKTGEIVPPRPRALDIGFQTRQRSLQELLALSSREHLYYEDDFDDDDLEFEADPISDNPLQTESTPHTDDFLDSHGISVEQATEVLRKAGRLPATERKEPVGKTKPAKSAPKELAPEPSLEPTGDDSE